MSDFILRTENLSLSIEGKEIYKDINIGIPQGQISLLSGPSGCGKSVFLMTLMRLVPEYIEAEVKGKIFFQGENILEKNIQDISSKIGFVFQDPDTQLCSFVVKEELAFGLENLCYSREEIEDRIYQIAKEVDMVDLLDRQVNSLSGGQKQKLALASILAMDPELIIMDEPTANLDPMATEQIVEIIGKLRDKGKTIILVEHKLEEFKDLIDQVFYMRDKRINRLDKDVFFSKILKENKFSPNPNRASEEKLLEVESLSFSYDNNSQLIRDVSFNLHKGEILGLIGRNGEGKSTLAKLIMGLLKANKGKILLKGKNINKLSPREIGQDIGLVFQNPEHQFIEMNVEDEMKLGLVINKADRIEEKTEEYLKTFKLYDKKDLNPFALSQGEKRRLSTASMMINGQDILILDEPSYGQDPANLEHLVELLYQVNRQGVSILMVSHDLNLIRRACHRYIFLSQGQISKEGPAEEISKEDFYYD